MHIKCFLGERLNHYVLQLIKSLCPSIDENLDDFHQVMEQALQKQYHVQACNYSNNHRMYKC